MAEGFRKAFLGFNCDDVINYIKKTHSEYSEEKEQLNGKIHELEKSVKELKTEKEDLAEELNLAKETIEQYKAKEEEINRISENIGKLYIVSEANAKAVTEAAEENRKMTEKEVAKNLAALKTAHEELTSIIKGVTDTSVDFSDSMKELSLDLEKTTEKIEQNSKKSAEAIENTKAALSPF
ncbi:MAG: hypothetical protein IJJ40_01130 [Clostridia bacterium]|nr:hypothetical protein [Clostridia bacterium]